MDFSKEEPNLPSDSDDSDEDYVPSGAESNPPSEVESDGDVENPESDEEEPSAKKRKREQKASKKRARKKGRKSAPNEDVRTEEKVDDDEEDDDNNDNKKKILTEEEEKKHADSLWANFMSDTKSTVPQCKKTTTTNSKSQETEDKISKEKVEPKKEEKENKVTITEVFEFAGEEVKVTKEVAAASKEARIANTVPKAIGSSSSGPAGRGRGRSSGGLSSVLGQLGKKSKIGTLEKSKLDWDHYKKSEGIEDELRTFNRGKDGYLEKQDFLQRTDLRQFEIEKGLRASRRSNR